MQHISNKKKTEHQMKGRKKLIRQILNGWQAPKMKNRVQTLNVFSWKNKQNIS